MSTSIPEIRVREKCATCAFRPGSGPNRSHVTLIKAKLCADTGTPFLCHEADRDAMCAGFAELIEKQMKSGQPPMPVWQRQISLGMLDVIQAFEDADKAGKPLPDFAEEMKKAMDAIDKRVQL